MFVITAPSQFDRIKSGMSALNLSDISDPTGRFSCQTKMHPIQDANWERSQVRICGIAHLAHCDGV